jgi:hypothetical protein
MRKMMRVPFNRIQFGYASAEVESSDAPELLLNAFLDPHNFLAEVQRGRRFLVLGFKGAGKSSIGLHLSLMAKQTPNLFVTPYFLADLSYKMLGKIVREEIENELRYPKAWSWVLLLALMTSVTRDQGARPSEPNEFHNTIRILKREGLVPTTNLGEIVGKSSLQDVQIKLWNFTIAGRGESKERSISLGVLIQHLRDLLLSVHTDSHHLLVIDGLDDVLLTDKIQLQALSSLLLEASRLNQHFREARAPFKIVVLCRTDIFERLPGPNQNKLRQDLAVELDWCEEATDPRRTNLVQLANIRARLADPDLQDVFSRHFPRVIERKDPAKYLLEYTRHTPRDFLQLLTYIQKANHSGRLQYGEISAGLRAYAEKFFVPEIRDELEGVVSRDHIDAIFEALRQYHRAEFLQEEFCKFTKERSLLPQDLDMSAVFRALYTCSAIGNIHITSQGQRRYSFRYRNHHSVYNSSDFIVVHRGLRRALLLPADQGGG